MDAPRDFAKIVLASNGQQVLFYMSSDEDDGNTLNCIADFGHYQSNMKVKGISDEAFEEILIERADVAMADKVIASCKGF